VLQERIAIKNCNFPHWRLGDEIEDIRSRAAHTEDGNPRQFELAHHISDADAP